jgi:hypothetical protein
MQEFSWNFDEANNEENYLSLSHLRVRYQGLIPKTQNVKNEQLSLTDRL